MGDVAKNLSEQVRQAFADQQPLRIVGGNSKFTLGRAVSGEPLELGQHTGIIDYQPTELVITARAGTPLAEIEATLAESGQMLAFEPPHLGASATLGGTIACGLSGPRRPFTGAARDFVLGVKMLNGRGELLQFGGQVMKNVAGYDVSRLQAGAQGTLGVLLEISLKVLPRPAAQCTLLAEMDAPTAIETMSHLSGTAMPLTAACHLSASAQQAGQLWLRLSGAEEAVAAANAAIQKAWPAFGWKEMKDDEPARGFWQDLRERRLPFFDGDDGVWCLSVPPATADFCGSNIDAPVNHPSFRRRPESSGSNALDSGPGLLHAGAGSKRRNDETGKLQVSAREVLLPGSCLLDWAGAQRWLNTTASADAVRAVAQQAGGHASLFTPAGVELAPLSPGLEKIHQRVKASFDPAGILNPGRLYEGL